MNSNPELSCYGQVRNNQRYVYATAPDLTLEVEGRLANGEEWDSDPALGQLVDEVQKAMEEWAHDFNREMEKGLYKELEYRQSEEALAEDFEANEMKFDEEGNLVNQVQNGRRARTGLAFQELAPEVKERVLDKYRDWSTEDGTWAEYMEDDYKTQLASMGFDGVEIGYSLGYGQGDGASFTAQRIDVPKFLEAILSGRKPTDVFNEAKAMVEGLLA